MHMSLRVYCDLYFIFCSNLVPVWGEKSVNLYRGVCNTLFKKSGPNKLEIQLQLSES